jgi:hypothetical protein
MYVRAKPKAAAGVLCGNDSSKEKESHVHTARRLFFFSLFSLELEGVKGAIIISSMRGSGADVSRSH